MIWSRLNYKATCLCSKYPDFIFLLNRLFVYSLPTAMSSVAGNRTMDFFYLLKENFKNLLFDSFITERSFENFSYLSSCSLSQRWRFRIILLNLLRDIESYLAYTKVSRVVSQCILRYGSLWHILSSSMLKNKGIFSNTNVCFLSMIVQLVIVKIHIN